MCKALGPGRLSVSSRLVPVAEPRAGPRGLVRPQRGESARCSACAGGRGALVRLPVLSRPSAPAPCLWRVLGEHEQRIILEVKVGSLSAWKETMGCSLWMRGGRPFSLPFRFDRFIDNLP